MREILPKGGARAYKRSTPVLQHVPLAGSEAENDLINRNYTEELETTLRDRRRMPKIPKYVIWAIGLLFVVLVIFIAGSFFTKVTAEIVPKQARINLSESITASHSAAEGELEFGTVSNVITEEVVVKASGTKEVEEKASGEITIYNDYSKDSQTLVAKTRFEAKNGKIYRITQNISVPGQKIEGGKTVPGSITVKVVADQAGAEYNAELTDFTIPGFRDSDRFDKFYARSKTAMTGGMIGTVSDISQSDREDAEATLKSKLASKTKDTSSLQIPDGHISFKDAIFTTTEFEVKNGAKAGEAKLVGKLTYTAIVFNKIKLATYLAEQRVSDYADEAVFLSDSSKINISLQNRDQVDISSDEQIEVKMTGTAFLVWTVNEDEFKQAIGGYNKGNFKLVIGDFPAIQSAKLKIVPPWVRSIPNDPNKIEVKQILATED